MQIDFNVNNIESPMVIHASATEWRDLLKGVQPINTVSREVAWSISEIVKAQLARGMV